MGRAEAVAQAAGNGWLLMYSIVWFLLTTTGDAAAQTEPGAGGGAERDGADEVGLPVRGRVQIPQKFPKKIKILFDRQKKLCHTVISYMKAVS